MNHTSHRTGRRLTALALTTWATALVLVLFVVPLTDSQQVVWLSWVGVLMLIVSLGSWTLLGRELLEPYPVLLVVAYVFMFGQCFLWAVGLEALPFDLRDLFDADRIVMAQTFTLLGLGAYHIGGLLVARKRVTQVRPTTCTGSPPSAAYLFAGIKAVGWLLFAVSLAPFIVDRLRAMQIAGTYGYSAIYRDPVLTQTGLAGAWKAIAQYFTLSLFALIVGYRNSAPIRSIWLGAAFLTAVASLYVGVRGPAFTLTIVLLLLWHLFVKPIRGRRLLAVIVVAWLLISLIPAVGATRGEVDQGLREFIRVWQSYGSAATVAALGELGGSMFPLIKTMELVPSQFPFRYGSSYAWAFTALLPNMGFWELHPASRNADLGYWLRDVLGLGYGPGYSWAAEAYINYGWFGIAVLFAMGAGFGWLFTIVDCVRAQRRPDLGLFMLIVLNLVMMTTRNSFIGTVRALAYYALPTYVGIHVVANDLRTRALRRRVLSPGSASMQAPTGLSGATGSLASGGDSLLEGSDDSADATGGPRRSSSSVVVRRI